MSASRQGPDLPGRPGRPDLVALAGRLAYLGIRLDLRHHQRLGSTNEVAAELALAGAAEGLVIMAEEQTAGRGRFERAWSSPAGGNLYLSCLLRPPSSASVDLAPLNLISSLGILDAVEQAVGQPGSAWEGAPAAGLAPAPRISLKWPNDLTVGGRKLCGLLSRLGHDPTGGAFVVVGVGLNVNVNEAQLPPRAVSLIDLTGAPVDRQALLEGLIFGLFERALRWRREGAAPQLEEWLRRSAWRGRQVSVYTGPDDALKPNDDPDAAPQMGLRGEVLGLTPGGALRLRPLGGGPEQVVFAGDVSLRDERAG